MRQFLTRPLILLAPALVGLGFAVASPASAGGGGGCHAPVTVASGPDVEIVDFCFSPTALEVTAGDTVTWTNQDQAPHTVTGANVSWGDPSDIGKDGSVSQTFRTPGVYPYYCAFHPGMIGAVLVRAGEDDGSPTVAAETAGSGGLPGAGYGLLGALAGVVLTGTGIAIVRRR